MAKSIMGEARAKYYDIRTDLFDYKRMEIDLKIDQIIHNEAIIAKEKEFIRQAGETFRNDVKIAQIKATDLKKKEEGDEHRSISKSS